MLIFGNAIRKICDPRKRQTKFSYEIKVISLKLKINTKLCVSWLFDAYSIRNNIPCTESRSLLPSSIQVHNIFACLFFIFASFYLISDK